MAGPMPGSGERFVPSRGRGKVEAGRGAPNEGLGKDQKREIWAAFGEAMSERLPPFDRLRFQSAWDESTKRYQAELRRFHLRIRTHNLTGLLLVPELTDEEFADLIEIALEHNQGQRAGISAALNVELAVQHAPFEVRKIEDKYRVVAIRSGPLSDLVVEPALGLLDGIRFPAAREEFERALRFWRNHDAQGCVTNAIAAVESVAKVVLEENNVHLEVSNWGNLRQALVTAKMLDPALLESLKTPLPVLIRNSLAHGGGTKIVTFDQGTIDLAMHEAAALIVFLSSLKRRPTTQPSTG
jgi:hypothetical protein